jgi:hypothetical protein
MKRVFELEGKTAIFLSGGEVATGFVALEKRWFRQSLSRNAIPEEIWSGSP